MPTFFGTGGRRYSTDSRIGLLRRGRLSRPHRLTTPWPSLVTTPSYNKKDNLPVHTIYINTSGRICLHELFIKYEQVTTWEARFLFQQI